MTLEEKQQFTLLWTRHQNTVRAFLLGAARDGHVADDLLQAVALVLLEKFEHYDPARPFIAWAMGFARI